MKEKRAIVIGEGTPLLSADHSRVSATRIVAFSPKQNLITLPSGELYERFPVLGDGNCGFTAFGITREYAYDLISENINSARDILVPLVEEILCTDENFIGYLSDDFAAVKKTYRLYCDAIESHNQLSEKECEKNHKRHAQDLNLLLSYVDYDIRDKCVDAGWAHPLVLFALAKIQRIPLQLWELNKQGKAIPHHRYSEYRPEGAEGDFTTLLFVHGNHFERLQKAKLTEAKEYTHVVSDDIEAQGLAPYERVVILPAAQTNATVWRLLAFGISTSLFAVQVIGNSIVISSLGPNYEASAGLITTIQGLITGTVFGFLLQTGISLGKVLGQSDAEEAMVGEESLEIDAISATKDRKIGSIIKTSWTAGYSLCVLGAAAFLLMRAILPHTVNPEIGKDAGDFFLLFSVASIFELMGGNNGFIIAQIEKNMAAPLLLAAGYRLPAVALGYLFAVHQGMGPMGVALGTLIPAALSFLVSQALLLREPYKNFELYKCYIDDFKGNLKSFLDGGWRLSLQRISEWGNLAAITMTIGALNTVALKVMQPAIQANTLIALAMQGMGQAAMMFIVQDCEKHKKYYEMFQKSLSRLELENFKNMISVNHKTFLKNNLAGLIITSALAGGIYLAKDPIINLFLGANLPVDQYALTDSFLFYILLSLIPDSVRIVSGGILRGWGDLLLPTIMSLVLMTVLGVPAGLGLSYLTGDNMVSFMWVRMVAIFLAAGYNVFRFYQHMRNDKQLYQQGEDALDVFDALNESDNTASPTIYSRVVNALSDYAMGLGFDEIEGIVGHKTLFEALSSEETTEEDLKIQVSQKIASKIKNYDKEDLMHKIKTGHPLANKVILEALSDELEMNLYVVNTDGEVITGFYTEDSDSVYLGYSAERRYYILTGEPNEQFERLLRKAEEVSFQNGKAPRFGSVFCGVTQGVNAKPVSENGMSSCLSLNNNNDNG